VNAQVLLDDDRAGPYARNDLVVRDEFACALDKQQQDVQGSVAEEYRPAMVEKRSPVRVKLKRAEPNFYMTL
jgi:hypothetical protein